MSLPIAYEARLAECGTKHMALYQALRDAIVHGTLPPDERLPSTRGLASLYGLSRGSVSLAYEMLASEGFVRTGIGQGTFVAGHADSGRRQRSDDAETNETAAEPALSAWGRRIAELHAPGDRPDDLARREDEPENRVSFVPHNIGSKWFPWQEWRAVVSAGLRKHGRTAGDAGIPAAGCIELRRAIAGRLRRERGIRCGAEDVVITGGSMQAIALLSQLLLESGRTAVAETPGYGGIKRAVLGAGAQLVSARIDGNGIVPLDWEADVLFVTPARQFPTGAVLTYERRLALLEWASRRGAWIVEDDYDSDFRWGGKPIEPLKSLDREGRVVHVGTFSRSMRTEVRIGFAVVPPALRDALIAAKKLYEPCPTGVAEQQALAEWMAKGGFDRHMRRMRRIYGRLEGTLRSELERKLRGVFRVFPSDAGLHLYAQWIRNTVQYDQLREECLALGVGWKDARVYDAPCRDTPPSAMFGFAHLDEAQIRQGVERIRSAASKLHLV